MASYADNRSALFGGAPKDGDTPKAKPAAAKARAPLTLGGPSAATRERKKRQDAELRTKGDAFFRAAEELMPPKKTGFAALMAKRPNPLMAAPEYARAAAAYAAADARPLALAAYEKAAACSVATEAHHTAALMLEKASRLAGDERAAADLGRKSARCWSDAGEALKAAEAAMRCATETLRQDGAATDAIALVELSLDYAEVAKTSAFAHEVPKSAMLFFARRGLSDRALEAGPLLIAALRDANLLEEAAPTRNRCLAAMVVLHLSDRANVEAADAAFMDALGYDGFAMSSQAEAAENLLAAFKPRPPGDEGDAFADALAGPALQSLDVEIASLAKRLPRPDPAVAAPAAPLAAPPPVAAVAAADIPDLPDDDDCGDDLPDFS